MFDTAKVQWMTAELENFAREHEDIYLLPEWLDQNAFALLKRMRITVRAILINAPAALQEISGCPLMSFEDAARNFTDRTGIIFLSAKPQPNPRNMMTLAVGNQQLNVPIFAMASDEVLAIYDRLTLLKVLQQYQEDGINVPAPENFAQRFARGLTTFLDPRFQNFKYQLWDSREYFKPTYDFDDTAIVIQGPIAYDNNHTVETFKLYRSIYPNIPIVVSTWKGEATDAFRQECAQNSVVLLENDLPEPQGPGHINCQLVSSFQGVKYIQENTSAKFVLKTRTDQRINRFDFLLYFKNLLETFPPLGDKLHNRIIFLNSLINVRPFYFCDYLSFGNVLDIFRLYAIPIHKDPGDMTYTFKNWGRLVKAEKLLKNTFCNMSHRSVAEQNRKLRTLNKIMSHFCNCEMYIARTFYKMHIGSIDKTKLYETSWNFAREYTLLINLKDILLDWFKYESFRYHCGQKEDTESFFQWLDMYRNFNIDWV